MQIRKRQQKITKLFRKTAPRAPEEDDCEELEQEVQELEQQLRDRQSQLFQLQRESCRRKASAPKKKDVTFVKPQKIILENSVESLKNKTELMSMLTGTEVRSYVAGEHCCVVFHMQHASEHAVSHGLRIDMSSGRNEVSAWSLPLGFNLPAVMEEFDNVMSAECLNALRQALVAYYDRLQQFDKLKELFVSEVQLFKTLDGSHIEISTFVQSEEDRVPLTLVLDYRVNGVRPKGYTIKELDLPDNAVDVIREQCAVFKRKPLHEAFKKAFLDSDCQFPFVNQMNQSSRDEQIKSGGPRRKRCRPPLPHRDDTFRPDDCSDQGEEDEEEAD